MVDTLSTLSASDARFYDRNLLYRAEQALVAYDTGQKKNIPANSGKNIYFRRYNALSVATTALTEGVTPSATALSQTEVTASLSQYGAYCELSDRLMLEGLDPNIAECTEIMGQQAGETIDTLVFDEIDSGTSVIYANGSQRSDVGATHVLTVALIRKGIRNLDRNNTMRFSGMKQNKKVGVGHYILMVHPNQVYDLVNDSEWKNHQQYSSPEKLYNGEIGEILGVRVVQSTLVPKYTAAGASSADVYGAIMCGQHFFGVVDVAGTGKFKTVVKQLGSGGTEDPLEQRSTVGWKSTFVTKILNNNFGVRIETGVTG